MSNNIDSQRIADQGDPWSLHAQQWALVGQPLRPGEQDVTWLQERVKALAEAQQGSALQALLLGVTPELATMGWPAGTALRAVDRSADMIAGVFPRMGVPSGAATVQADWRQLPFETGAFDVLVGDGCLNTFVGRLDYLRFAKECARVLRQGGELMLRLFTAPAMHEELSDVSEALWEGEIGNFHVLKWRLAMAVQPSSEDGVRLGDIWAAFSAMCPDRRELVAKLAWEPAIIATIDNYRDSDTRYSFPTLAEAREVLARDFVEVECHMPAYELGARCPTLRLAPAPAPGGVVER